MRARLRESTFLTLVFALMFLGLSLLSIFLLTGESRRARILVEYEADRTASQLFEQYWNGDTPDPGSLDGHVKGFGIYRGGAPDIHFGDAPPSAPVETRSVLSSDFTYDEAAGTLTLLRPLGMGGAHLSSGMMGMAQGGPGMMRGRTGGVLYLSLDIHDFFSKKRAYTIALLLAPVLIAGVTAAFLLLALSNLRYRRQAESQENLARLGEVSRTLAHEVRNPLGAIRMQTGLLRKTLPAVGQSELDTIDEEVDRLALLSRRVGDFLKNPKGSPQRVDVASFLADLARRFPFPVSFRDEGTAGAAVEFDRDLLRSVIENLVRNAHQSYGEGDDPSGREVTVGLRERKGALIITVSDRGRGITRATEERRTDGLGIGLSIARRFVEAAGGSLTLAPRDGGGTEARVELPAGGT